MKAALANSTAAIKYIKVTNHILHKFIVTAQRNIRATAMKI